MLLFRRYDEPLLIFPSDDEEDEDEEDEDETAELLRELEKIKRERAEEQARKVSIEALSIVCFIQVVFQGTRSKCCKRLHSRGRNRNRQPLDEPAGRFGTRFLDFHRRIICRQEALGRW